MLDLQDVRITSYLPQSGHGAGGMTVGLTTSGIIVHHMPTGLGISCDSERSQHANKNKALALLESLLLAIESEKRFPLCPEMMHIPNNLCVETPLYNAPEYTYATTLEQPNGMQHKVRMIKDVRERAGCGLKEAKEAVDAVYEHCSTYDDVVFQATMRALR